MLAFVTVGSTHFDPLVDAVLSTPVINALARKGCERLVVQCGAYAGTSKLHGLITDGVWSFEREHVRIDVWKYRPTLSEEIQAADLVISHAGSGTIIDTLRSGKPLIVVPNPSLLDNHQIDLAEELDRLGYLKSSTTKTLADDIVSFRAAGLQPFPPMDPTRFRNLLDEEMGFL